MPLGDPKPRLELVPQDDVLLVARTRAGDRDAFRLLVERWQTMVFGLALRMTGNRGLAEDLAQETFLRAYQRIGEFEGASRFSTWLYAIARNLVLDDRKRKRVPLADGGELPDLASGDPTPEDTARETQARTRLEVRLLALPVSQREAFILRHVEGLEYDEIAARCGTTVNNAKVRVHRAREALERMMRGADDDGRT